MAGRPIPLEPFDRVPQVSVGGLACSGSTLQSLVAVPDVNSALAPGQDASSAEAPAALEDPDMAGEADGAQAAEEVLRADSLVRIANALETIAAEGASAHTQGMRAAAEGFARAAAAALPSFVETGFAAEVAAASLEIARAIRPEPLILHLAPEDLEAVDQAMLHCDRGGQLGDLPLQFEADPRIAPGEAALRWTGGGAEIEVDTLTRLALDHLDRAVNGAGPATQPDETEPS